jgi:hypothetical protein
MTAQVPEMVPFRLTQNVIDSFGVSGIEGTYRKSAETTLQVGMGCGMHVGNTAQQLRGDQSEGRISCCCSTAFCTTLLATPLAVPPSCVRPPVCTATAPVYLRSSASTGPP